ncbi:tripartite tricarboxylate transporter TctB family protein [Marinococcus sp. PL1-022]|jgi:putative tricarboxylic transport membrane protein|uniref:tripartite tricarboxylate transporter TctB family protein n=1 Tax=Marinococcus sp. PL1-022 TaxID=3095363 RepID=UPI0026139195|nr:tripartite tricarboxylate transporter TctB family protein [Marinococcus sp. PL1-022]MDX6153866.1 tripartite tricarboxylate transporter TctB family protein [Marinococcus sp. PL1-022]
MLRSANKIVSIILIVTAVFYLYLAFQIPAFATGMITASTMPKAAGFLLIVLSIFLFFIKEGEGEEDREKRKEAGQHIFYLGGVAVMILIYITLLEPIGFILTSTIFIFLCSLFMGYRKHIINAVTSIAFPLTLYLLFTQLLNISLPPGILPL